MNQTYVNRERENIYKILLGKSQESRLDGQDKADIRNYLLNAIGQSKEDGSYSTQAEDSEACEMIRNDYPELWAEVWSLLSFRGKGVHPNHKVITEERYDYFFEVLPPLWVSHLDKQAIKGGFAVSEAYTHTDKAVVLTVCYEKDGGFYECLAEMYKHTGKAIWDTYNHCYSKDNYGETWMKR